MARKYEKSRRAELEEATRLRITKALVALHGTLGPARTTIQAVAAKAGVQRATVYRHFPDEPAMFAACSAHWAEKNPLPDPAAWADVGQRRRIPVALGELYAFYARNERMLGNVFRDATLVEAMAPAVQALRGYLAAAADVLAGDDATPVARAAVAHALAFTTWRSLVRENGLSADAAVALMAGLIRRAR
ncbi:MAG: TetR/AcrR family transcriptional regulator [Planctomycetota bacterium]